MTQLAAVVNLQNFIISL